MNLLDSSNSSENYANGRFYALNHYWAVPCPTTQKLERATTLEYPLKPLWYNTCLQLVSIYINQLRTIF